MTKPIYAHFPPHASKTKLRAAAQFYRSACIPPGDAQVNHAWDRGLRHDAGVPCPRKVAGLRCLASSSGQCVCIEHFHVLDHARLWSDVTTGEVVLTSEPYDVGGEELMDFLSDMNALNLRVTVSGASSWYPGSTFLIELRPKSAAPAGSGGAISTEAQS